MHDSENVSDAAARLADLLTDDTEQYREEDIAARLALVLDDGRRIEHPGDVFRHHWAQLRCLCEDDHEPPALAPRALAPDCTPAHAALWLSRASRRVGANQTAADLWQRFDVAAAGHDALAGVRPWSGRTPGRALVCAAVADRRAELVMPPRLASALFDLPLPYALLRRLLNRISVLADVPPTAWVLDAEWAVPWLQGARAGFAELMVAEELHDGVVLNTLDVYLLLRLLKALSLRAVRHAPVEQWLTTDVGLDLVLTWLHLPVTQDVWQSFSRARRRAVLEVRRRSAGCSHPRLPPVDG